MFADDDSVEDEDELYFEDEETEPAVDAIVHEVRAQRTNGPKRLSFNSPSALRRSILSTNTIRPPSFGSVFREA